MRKIVLGLLTIAVLAICLVFGILPPAAVSAAADSGPAWSSAGPSGTEAAPVARSAQPVVFVVTGLVCALIAVIAVSPLLIDEPGRVHAAPLPFHGSEQNHRPAR